MFEIAAWSELIFDALSIVVLGLVGIATRWLITWLKTRGIIEQIVAKEELAMVVIGFVEQVYQGVDGPEKLEAAVYTLADRLQQYGLSYTEDELYELIEDAVNQMQEIWSDELDDL